MEAVTDGWIPQWAQFVGAGLVGFGLIAGTVIKYFRDLRKPSPAIPVDVTLLGAAFNDARALQQIAEALETIAQTAKEVRAIHDKEAERDLQRLRDAVGYLERIADAIEDQAKTSP